MSTSNDNFTKSEADYLENVVKILKWTEEWTAQLRDQLEAGQQPNMTVTELLASFFGTDRNGNPYPLTNFTACMTPPNTLK
ncbi:unnamed protein product [Caenorhabditis bovis]|uniref:Uncharacterized protein n=1 Tax=Caenorhabditis bovis TaxID=2654633 RepID=A0A8S1EIP9_9PELO|nr:unnamed protein product [Caenorhabditis bovis]